MSRPQSRQIDEQAKTVLRAAVAEKWDLREQHPDYRIDYVVEPFDGEESTGSMFFVQWKGKQSPKFTNKGKCVTFPIESEHLAYYFDKVQLPVFLVVIDVQRTIGWWMFLQGYVEESLSGKEWRKQTTVSLKVPTTNVITDLTLWLESARDAFSFMRNKYPGSIDAALKAEKQRLEQLDPRFKFDVSANADGKHVKFSATEDVKMQLHAQGSEACEKLRKLIEFGGTEEFASDELSITGSPLFEDGLDFHALGIRRDAPASVRIIPVRRKSQLSFIEIPGKISLGTKGGNFVGELEGSPLSLKLPLDLSSELSHPQFGFEISKWYGQPIQLIGQLDQFLEFYDSFTHDEVASGDVGARLDIFVRGNRMVQAVGNKDVLVYMLSFENLVRALGRARAVAKTLAINPAVPNPMSDEHLIESDVLFDIVNNRDVRVKAPAATLKITLGAEGVTTLLDQKDPRGRGIAVSLPHKEPFRFFGQEYILTGIQFEFTSMKMKSGRRELRRFVRCGETNSIKIEFEATMRNQYVVRKTGDIRRLALDALSPEQRN